MSYQLISATNMGNTMQQIMSVSRLHSTMFMTVKRMTQHLTPMFLCIHQPQLTLNTWILVNSDIRGNSNCGFNTALPYLLFLQTDRTDGQDGLDGLDDKTDKMDKMDEMDRVDKTDKMDTEINT